MPARSIEARLKKSLARFKNRIEDGSYYEAQQTIRAIANRYVHAENYGAACELLYQSAMILTDYKKYDEASDLYLYLLEVFGMENKSVGEFEKSDLIKVFDFLNALPDKDANIPNLAVETTKFTTKMCDNEIGLPALNHLIGEKLYYSGNEKSINLSQRYLFLSEEISDVKLLADLYYGTYSHGADKNGFGEYLARLVVPYLLLKEISFANEGLKMMLLKAEEDKVFQADKVQDLQILEPDSSETVDEETSCKRLVNFIQLLVYTCERSVSQNAENFTLLFNTYRPVLDRYGGLTEMINTVGQKYFNVTVVQKQANLFSMMGNLLGGKQ